MKTTRALAGAVVLVSLPALGCNDLKTREIERQRAELEATKAELVRVRAEAQQSRDELIQALADAQAARTELARLKGEPAPKPAARPTEPEAAPVEQRLTSLKANYDKNAVDINEWTRMKARVIESIPADLPITDKRSLGQRLIDLKGCYDKNAVDINEWTKAKAKLVVQVPSLRAPAPSLDREISELKKAYDANAVDINEWTKAKAEVMKWAK
jgi:hypothetical protein